MNLPRLSLLSLARTFLVGTILSSASFAQSSAVDDAYTKTPPANANFGDNSNLKLSSAGNVYLKFDLASSIPSGTPGSMVDKAVITLFIRNISSPGKLDVYEVSSTWQESTLTANNAPMLGTLVATTQQIAEDEKEEFLVIDITSTVKRWLGSDGQGAGGIPNYGIALVANLGTPETANITFDSKENPQTSHEPRLNILLKSEAASGLQTVTHDATLAGDGTNGSPLRLADGGVGSTQLSNGAVTQAKLGDGAVTAVKLADGAVTSAKISAPLSLTSLNPVATLFVSNTGAGAAIQTTGAIHVIGNGVFTGNLLANFINTTGLRTEPTPSIPNVIGGFSGNNATTGVAGAFIGGGGRISQLNRVTDDFGTIGGGLSNRVGDDAGTTSDNGFATVGGGTFNTASGNSSTIGGGVFNTASGGASFIGGGSNNITNGSSSTVGGGFNNGTSGHTSFIGGGANNVASGPGSIVVGGLTSTASGGNSIVGGGSLNTASGFYSVVPGGFNNTAAGDFSFAAGRSAQANHPGAFVWADPGNTVFASTANNQFLIRASGGVGIGTNAPTAPLHVNGIIRVDTLGAAGADQLCRNASNQISSCSSSLRYKDRIAPFTSGLDLIGRLRPITFSWRVGGRRDLGLGAEEVAEVDPLLVTRNGKGEVEGVKYDRIAVVLVNAVNEQQQLIKAQQLLLESQQRQIELLKEIVCRDRPDAQICK